MNVSDWKDCITNGLFIWLHEFYTSVLNLKDVFEANEQQVKDWVSQHFCQKNLICAIQMNLPWANTKV